MINTNGHSAASIRTICVFGHNPISTALLTSLSTLPDTTLHLLHQSPHSPSLPISGNLQTHHCKLSTLPTTLPTLSPRPDLFISTTHGGDLPTQLALLSACKAASIPRFLPAEFSHDSLCPTISSALPPHAQRAKLIAKLREDEEFKSIEWVGLATGYQISQRLVDGNMGVELAWQSATVFGSGNERFFASTAGWVGEAVKAVVQRWDSFRGRYVCVAGLRTDMNSIVSALEGEMGCRFEIGLVEREEGLQEAERRIKGGFPDAGMFLTERATLADEKAFEGFERDLEVRKELGLEELDLKSVIHEVVHQSKHHGKGGCGCS